jgi:hypothetical protein
MRREKRLREFDWIDGEMGWRDGERIQDNRWVVLAQDEIRRIGSNIWLPICRPILISVFFKTTKELYLIYQTFRIRLSKRNKPH